MGNSLFKVTDFPTLTYYSTNADCMGLYQLVIFNNM